MKAPSPPPPPDPYKTATAQQLANIEVAVANTALQNADEYMPDGRVNFSQIGTVTINTYQYDSNGNLTGVTPREIERWKKVTTLTPNAQRQFDQQQDIAIQMNTWALAQLNDLILTQAEPFDLDDLTPRSVVPAVPDLNNAIPTPGALVTSISPGDLTAHIATTRDAIDSRIQYQIDLDRNNLIARLGNQGIFAGATAYTRELDTFDKQSTDARIQAWLAAQQEQSRIVQTDGAIGDFANRTVAQKFEMDMAKFESGNAVLTQEYQLAISRCEYINAVRSQELQEEITSRAQAINEISTLMHGGQVQLPRTQQYQGGQVGPTPVGEYVYRTHAAKMDAWKTKVAYQQSMMGGMMSLGGSLMGAMMMSDRRLKRDVVQIGEWCGLAVYRWVYVWGTPGVGVMAQDVLKVMPAAVVRVGKWLAVDYGRLAHGLEA